LNHNKKKLTLELKFLQSIYIIFIFKSIKSIFKELIFEDLPSLLHTMSEDK
jgi:hypothetical protein